MTLRERILRTLLVLIALTLAFSLALGYLAAQRQFEAFVQELSRREADKLAARLSQAFTAAGDWSTVHKTLATAGYLYEAESENHESAQEAGGEGELFHVDRVRVVITDAEGGAIADNFGELRAGQRSADLPNERRAIRDLRANQLAGYVYADIHQNFLEAESIEFLRDLLVHIAVGGAVILSIAAGLAASLSKRIIAPVSALTRAASAFAQQESAERLPVDSSDELGQMSAAFNTMTSALQRQRQLRRRLVDDIAHELNTPLTVIQLEAKGLQDGLQTPVRAAHNIIGEVGALRYLTDDLNWLAETDSGEWRLKREACDLAQLLKSEVARWQPLASAQSANLTLETLPDLPSMQLDSRRMRQALGNILHNALRHADARQALVAASMNEDGAANITIRDDGAGIAPEDLAQVFNRNYGAGRSRGAGLGLDIARAIIEAHGGQLALRSDGINCGATVEIRLPIA